MSSTRRKKTIKRKITRGDFGIYPSKEKYTPSYNSNILSEHSQTLGKSIYCGGSILDNELPKDWKTFIESFPPNKRCAEYSKLLTETANNKKTKNDKRTIHLPKYGEIEKDERYKKLNRLERARLHFNRARQMYLAGTGYIKKGIELNSQWMIKKGNGMIYSIDPKYPHRHKKNKTSSSYELYEGYRYIRKYEMNPLPPLTQEYKVNENRLYEDNLYQFLMGTFRLNPNRLGLGSNVRKIWKEFGYIDPNYLDIDEHIEDIQPLYGNVISNIQGNSETVEAYKSFINLLLEQGIDPSVDYEDLRLADLIRLGYDKISIRTDVSFSLENLHNNFVPPKVAIDPETNFLMENIEQIEFMSEEGEGELPSIYFIEYGASIGPPSLIYPPYAFIDKPYPPNSWPWDGSSSKRFKIRQPPDFIPAFFPTGVSFSRNKIGPPYRNSPPDPLIGLPDKTGERWDIRTALSFLKSYHKKLEETSFEYSKRKRLDKMSKREINNLTPISKQTPIPLWKKGKIIPMSHVPSTFEKKIQDELRNRVWSPDIIPSLGYSDEISTEPTPTLRDKSITYYPYGMDKFYDPIYMTIKIVSNNRETQLNLLQHALYKLSAPPNRWQHSHFIENQIYPSSQIGIYGDNVKGEGYYGQNDKGAVDFNILGWRGYLNPFKYSEINGRNKVNFEQLIVKNIITNRIPIGPLLLDPKFGTENHTPPFSIKKEEMIWVWVIRTNQKKVLGINTWGLDFYAKFTDQ